MLDLNNKLPDSRAVAKVLLCLAMGTLTEACGIAKNNGHFVMGSTSFLAEYQRAQLATPKPEEVDEITETDRRQLNAFIRRVK